MATAVDDILHSFIYFVSGKYYDMDMLTEQHALAVTQMLFIIDPEGPIVQ